MQRLLGDPRPAHDLPVKEVGLAAEGQGGHAAPQDPVASPPPVAGVHVWARDSSAVGASGCGVSHAGRAARTSLDEVRPDSKQPSPTPLKNWERGQVQQLKLDIKSVQQAVEHLSMVASSVHEVCGKCWRFLVVVHPRLGPRDGGSRLNQ